MSEWPQLVPVLVTGLLPDVYAIQGLLLPDADFVVQAGQPRVQGLVPGAGLRLQGLVLGYARGFLRPRDGCMSGWGLEGQDRATATGLGCGDGFAGVFQGFWVKLVG